MVIMIPYSLDEFVAMGQLLVDARRKGQAILARVLDRRCDGGRHGRPCQRSGRADGRHDPSGALGVTLPWALLASCAVGLWFMFTRLSFGTSGQMANSDHLFGALVVTFAIIAFAEVARPLHFINMAFGLWLIAATWLLTGNFTPFADWAGRAGGILLIALSIPRGRIAN